MDNLIRHCGIRLEYIGAGFVISLVVIPGDRDFCCHLNAAGCGGNHQTLQHRGFCADPELQCGGSV